MELKQYHISYILTHCRHLEQKFCLIIAGLFQITCVVVVHLTGFYVN